MLLGSVKGSQFIRHVADVAIARLAVTKGQDYDVIHYTDCMYKYVPIAFTHRISVKPNPFAVTFTTGYEALTEALYTDASGVVLSKPKHALVVSKGKNPFRHTV